jgi:hypothetical protein
MSTSYSPSVDRLLTLGKPEVFAVENWPDYVTTYELTPEHVPDLVQLMLNWSEESPDWETNPAVFAPIHAWRALTQLQPEAVIAPLIQLLPCVDSDDEWLMEEAPDVFRLIGPTAIPALEAYMMDAKNRSWSLTTAGNSLAKIAIAHPDQRSPVVSILTTALAGFADHEPEINGFLLAELLELKAVEAAPTIAQAFTADQIDESIAGDWECVQVALGLKSADDFPENPWLHPDLYRSRLAPTNSLREEASGFSGSGKSSNQSKERARNKMARQSRKKNRVKKKKK